MSLTPVEQYQQDLMDPHFQADPTQARAIAALQNIYQQLIQREQHPLLQKFFNKKSSIQGLYLWGSVGTGKSYLMNTFFHCLPFKKKLRLHFHEFMRLVHEELRILQGQKNPLDIIAKQWAKKTVVLCFDEFFVKDIADAMVLANLLSALFKAGVCLIATSNVQPEDLYQKGLQRERFLPAIDILLQHVAVLQVDNHIDYRLQHVKPAHVYFSPLNQTAEQNMMQSFHYYVAEDSGGQSAVLINQRELNTVRCAERMVWFTFDELCNKPRSVDDYLAIAERFPVIMLSNVPIFAGKKYDSAVRFINLIDVLYDQHRLLIMSAAAPINDLYQDMQWAFEFQRTKSRLQEMTSETYIESLGKMQSGHPSENWDPVDK